MYLNKAIIYGNLTRDPELRTIPSGTQVVNFSVATDRIWKDKTGTKQQDTQFHNVVFFGAPAATIAQYLKKGAPILVEGRIQTRSWEAPDGQKKYRMEIVGENFQFGPSSVRRDGSGTVPAADNITPSTSSGPAEAPTIQYPEENINPEDIPF